ncbi:hypothetical protein KKB64_02020 [Patescibacteria group bacterium]|nr:hypothetical protein [Patescibacteria group bacterium]MBU1472547.1 hypothetical protein [Patescibacteria group bacterium]MBU2460079.1 hypothetical protein [Patescibacteria group bacterium]MBU2544648.1 hypothetical protein [Patescibacteria group bacterium]
MKKVKSNNSSLTESDIAKLINRMKIVFPTIDEVCQIVQKEIKFLPTKEEFFSRMDKLSKEIQDARDELGAHASSHTRLDDAGDEMDKRVSTIEKKLNLSPLAG